MSLQSDTGKLFQWDFLWTQSLLFIQMRRPETIIIWFGLFHLFFITHSIILILRLIFRLFSLLTLFMFLLLCFTFYFFIDFLPKNFQCWSWSLFESCHLQNLIFTEFGFFFIIYLCLLCNIDFNTTSSKSNHCWEKHHLFFNWVYYNFLFISNFE